MASTLFSINPTTGRGNTTVNVSVNEVNSGTQDKVATVTATNGANSDTVTLRQKYCPYFVQFASTTFPASGGDIYFTIHSEYDVVFRSVPNWITISDGHGTTFAEGQRISSGTVDGETFTLTADANTGDARTVTGTFNMGHYIGLTLQNRVTYFSFTQEAYVPPTPPTPTVTWHLISNVSGYDMQGNILKGNHEDYDGYRVEPGQTQEHTSEVPTTINEIWVGPSPVPPTSSTIVFTNTRTNEQITCNYEQSASAWIGTGTMQIALADVIQIDMT